MVWSLELMTLLSYKNTVENKANVYLHVIKMNTIC